MAWTCRRISSTLAAILPAIVFAAARPEAAAAAPHALRWKRLGNESGLSHNSVYALLQDRQGFLWVGTVSGLDRYDGYAFVHYRHDPGDPSTLSNPIVRVLFEDRQGRLWVGTDNGVSRLDRSTGRVTRYVLSLREGHEARIVWSIHQDRRGTIWLGTERGLMRFDEAAERFRPHPLAGGESRVPCVVEDGAGRLWATSNTSDGRHTVLHRVVETGPPEPPYRFEPESPGLVSGAVLFDRAGRLWLHPPAPARIDEAARRIALPPGDRSGFAPSAILEDRSGTLWFGNHLGGGILRVWPDGTAAAQPVDPAGGWLPNAVRAILEDRSGAIWLGTLGGLYRHDPNAKPFRCVAHDKTDPNSLSDSAVSSLWEAPDGVLWIGTFGGGLNRWDRATERVSRFRARAGDRSRLRHDIVWAVEGDRGGRIWLATEDGLCSLEPGSGRFTWHDLPGLTRGPGLTRLSKLAVDEAGTLWVGSPNGVHAVETGTGAVRRSFFIAPGEGGRHLVVDSLLADGQGGFWMGSGAHGLLLRRLDPETGIGEEHALLGRDGRPLSAEGIWMIHRDRRGRLWLATGVGLSRFDPRSGETTHYFERDGLPGAIVYGILEDAGGRLWLSTDRGLSVFDERAEAQRRFRNFDSSDGICGNEFNRGAALRSRSGEFVFGGLDGLTIFDPQAIRDNPYVPPVQLTGIEVWGRGGTRAIAPYGLERLTLPWHDDSFALSFAALSFGAAEKSRYAYRLEGLDRDWVEAGGHRQARYTNVPPGRYTFRVKGASPDGVWNHEGATVAITLTPPFWQRLWFRGLMFGMLVGMAYAGHRYRVAKLLEMERLRLRIASDLHDDLSSDLSAIAMVTDMMQRRSELAEPERSRLAELRDKALEMAGSLRDVVWYVQPEHDTLEAIVRRMRTTAASLLGDTSCSFEIDLPGERGGVHMATRRNLFLIYKELIHNVARHAGATSVSVSLKAEDGRLLLRVRDDGKGFDATASHAGEGLRSVRRRAQQIGAALEIVSRPGQGTEVRLTMDLARTRDARRRRDLL